MTIKGSQMVETGLGLIKSYFPKSSENDTASSSSQVGFLIKPKQIVASFFGFTKEETILTNTINPKIHQNALRILNLSEEEALNESVIDEKYHLLIQSLEQKQAKVPISLKSSFQKLIQDAHQAYKTINQSKHQEDIMSTRVPSILKTPLEIYNLSRECFPGTQADVKFDSQENIIVVLHFSKGLPPLFLDHAIDSQEFSKEISKLFKIVQSENFSGIKTAKDWVWNVDQFSTMSPLSDWKGFQRALYVSQQFEFFDLIKHFLENPEDSQTIDRLALSPQFVESEYSSIDMKYFREFFEKLQTLPKSEKKAIFAHFQKLYPNVSSFLIDEMARKSVEYELRNRESIYSKIHDILSARVIGQSQATEKLASLLKTQKKNPKNKVFLFVGPTGVGKTELAKAVGKLKEDRLIVFNMNQYQEEHQSSLFFGAGLGLVGSTDKPHFAKAIDRYNPIKVRTEGSKETYLVKDIVLLLDEFEKAHTKIKQSFLTLFDEAYCTVSYTRDAHSSSSENVTIQYNLQNSVIIGTSNLYQRQILNAFASDYPIDVISSLFVKLNEEMPELTSYSPELLGRLSVIPFGPIPRGEPFQKLAKIKLTAYLKELKELLSCKDVVLEDEDKILKILEDKLYGEGINMRKFVNFFDDVNNLIYQKEDEWGDTKTKKLIFRSNGGDISIKILTFIKELDYYGDPKLPELKII